MFFFFYYFYFPLLSPAVLATLSIQLNEEVTVDSLSGLTQKMVCTKVEKGKPRRPYGEN